MDNIVFVPGFLSTLSLRRATCAASITPAASRNFYPRSPCGERPTNRRPIFFWRAISIHALLAESDTKSDPEANNQRISIHALLAESDVGQNRLRQKLAISIHALLAESDNANLRRHRGDDDFYPRSPCGERQCAASITPAASRNFYPRSPCGERRKSNKLTGRKLVFLSTLSLRRATALIHSKQS